MLCPPAPPPKGVLVLQVLDHEPIKMSADRLIGEVRVPIVDVIQGIGTVGAARSMPLQEPATGGGGAGAGTGTKSSGLGKLEFHVGQNLNPKKP